MPCPECGALPTRPDNLYCSGLCYRLHRSKKAAQVWLDGKETTHGQVPKSIRNHLKRTRGEACEQCGWNERNPVTGSVPVEVDHIDGDHSNNSEDNLRLLCPNCHSLTPTYRALNKGHGRSARRA